MHQSLVLRNAFLILKLLQIPTTIEHAKQLVEKLKTKDAKFNSFHLEVIDLIDEADTEALENEQETLDEHEDFVADMSICLKRLCTDATPADLKRISRKLHWSKSLLPYTMPSPYYQQIMTTCHSLNNMNTIIRIQLQYKMELSALHMELLSVEDEDQVKDQLTACSKIQDMLFECFLKDQKLK